MRGVPLITCEHASRAVPPSLRRLFCPHLSLLKSHRGFDIGARETACELAAELQTEPILGKVSRLIVDLNRSIGHPRLSASWVRAQGSLAVEQLLTDYYLPHRQHVSQKVCDHRRANSCTYHLGIHSFTPHLNGKTRLCDIGLLFDPGRPLEVALARRLKNCLAQHAPNLQVRFNYPYLGISDGLTTALRLKHTARSYVGVEVEINQALVRTTNRTWSVTRRQIVRSLYAGLQSQSRAKGWVGAR